MAEALPRSTPGTGFHCIGKEGFDTGQQAIRAAKNIMRSKKGHIQTYRCPTCSKFHIGRNNAPKTFKHQRT